MNKYRLFYLLFTCLFVCRLGTSCCPWTVRVCRESLTNMLWMLFAAPSATRPKTPWFSWSRSQKFPSSPPVPYEARVPHSQGSARTQTQTCDFGETEPQDSSQERKRGKSIVRNHFCHDAQMFPSLTFIACLANILLNAYVAHELNWQTNVFF